jgi:predicted transposase YbfD/YdcC
MERGENEITAALPLLGDMNLAGKVVTGDAIFAQKKSVRSSGNGAEIMSSPSRTTSAS